METRVRCCVIDAWLSIKWALVAASNALQALLRDLGSQSQMDIAGFTVDPRQFLGLEVNPRAACIAETPAPDTRAKTQASSIIRGIKWKRFLKSIR